MKKTALLPLLLLCGMLQAAPALVPWPKSVTELSDATFMLGPKSTIVADEIFLKEAEKAAPKLTKLIQGAHSLPTELRVTERGWLFDRAGDITLTHVEGLHPEGYRLTAKDGTVEIEATTPAGAFYGMQTLYQLIDKSKVPEVKIEDEPRLAWRGIHFDDSRHFIGAEGFKNMVNAMAAHKMNTLHWHLTDDQGWRIEIKAYPEIVEKGAVRAESPIRWDRWRGDKTPYGPYFYTQEQIRELVAYAAERHVTVVPEIEMPGHSIALLAAFPELGCTGGPYETWCRWGVTKDIVCAGNDKVLRVYETILDEVLALFPSKFIHCGGDEAPKDRWMQCPKCNERIKQHNLGNCYRLQTWFMQHFANYLEAKGRHMIGWDEILEGGLPKGAAVMSWRGADGGIAAAKMGHDVVMTPNSHVYLDYGQGIPNDPYEYNCANVPLSHVYTLNPTDKIPEAMHKHVIGVQGNLWSEYIWDAPDQEWKAWPRACAIAEIGWTPQDKRNWNCFRARMEAHYPRLKELVPNAAPLGAK